VCVSPSEQRSKTHTIVYQANPTQPNLTQPNPTNIGSFVHSQAKPFFVCQQPTCSLPFFVCLFVC